MNGKGTVWRYLQECNQKSPVHDWYVPSIEEANRLFDFNGSDSTGNPVWTSTEWADDPQHKEYYVIYNGKTGKSECDIWGKTGDWMLFSYRFIRSF